MSLFASSWRPPWVALLFIFLTAGKAVSASDPETAGTAPLLGIFYDLKLSADKVPTGLGPKDYSAVVDEFISKGWDETVLNRFFRSAKLLETTQIYIPLMSSTAAPKSFGVEKEIKRGLWIIHYKGQIAPPEDGTYRFVGYGDDLLIVAINGKVVLNGSRAGLQGKNLPHIPWKPSEFNAAAGNGRLSCGDWIPFTTAEAADIDILIGDEPGGQYGSFLMIEKQGENYQLSEQTKSPILPVFQVAPYDGTFDTSKFGIAQIAPGLPWKSLQ